MKSSEEANPTTEFGKQQMAMAPFLASSEVIDWQQPDVFTLAGELRDGSNDPLKLVVARKCFEWVRDNIQHSVDFGRDEVTCNASDVLKTGTGFCYAKSHLLAALLRANGIPAGLCYQRLSLHGDGPPFCLHGLNAVRLPNDVWYRVDARGDKDGIRTDFSPPLERLAFAVTSPGEMDFPEVWSEPLPLVVNALRAAKTAQALQANLPDIPLIDSA